MLRAAIAFFILGLIAILFGAYGLAGISIQLGKILFVIFIVMAVLSFALGLLKDGGHRRLP